MSIIVLPKGNARVSISHPIPNLESEPKPLSACQKQVASDCQPNYHPLKSLTHADAVVLALASRSRTYWTRAMMESLAKLANVLPDLTYANFRQCYLPLDYGGAVQIAAVALQCLSRQRLPAGDIFFTFWSSLPSTHRNIMNSSNLMQKLVPSSQAWC